MKKILLIIIIAISLYIIKGLSASIYSLWQKQDLVIQAQKELDLEKKQNETLKQQLSYTQTEQFVEEEARNKLFMVKQNEQAVILPESIIKNEGVDVPVDSTPNWKKWLNLFF